VFVLGILRKKELQIISEYNFIKLIMKLYLNYFSINIY